MLYGVQTLVCSRRASTIAHIYPSVLQAIVGGAMRNVWRGDFMGYWGVVMQDPACELPRITIPRTPLNKGKKKQLSWMSRGKVVRRPPRGAVFEDGVEDREQLAHAGYQSHLLRFAGR